MKFLRRIGIVISLLACIVASSCSNDEPAGDDTVVKVGDKVPDFSVVMDDGSLLTSEMLRGKESMIVFFTTTCSDCRRELPRINAYSLKHPGVNVVCIARNQTREQIDEFWKTENLSLRYSPQSDAVVYNLFAKSGVPRIYCVDAGLKIVAIYVEQFPL